MVCQWEAEPWRPLGTSQSPNEPSATNLSPARHWGRALHTMKLNNCAGLYSGISKVGCRGPLWTISGSIWNLNARAAPMLSHAGSRNAQPELRAARMIAAAPAPVRPPKSCSASPQTGPPRRPYHNVPALDARDVQDDPVMLMVVDDAPGVACVRVIAVQAPVVSLRAHRFETANFRALVLRPILAGQR